MSTTGAEFLPQHLHLFREKRIVAKKIVLNFFKKAVELSNSNLIRNGNYLFVRKNKEVSWIDKDKKERQITQLLNFFKMMFVLLFWFLLKFEF